MPYSVSSSFVDGVSSNCFAPLRKFTIGTSDYSAFVAKWPKIKRQWNQIRPKDMTLTVANEDKTFNFMLADKTFLNTQCKVELGITHAVGSEETIEMFSGTIEKLSFSRGAVAVTLMDKTKPFAEKLIGTNDNPVDYTGSNYLVSDLAWYVCTSHGGFSAVESTSNPDIDYSSFLEWSAIFSDNNVLVHALYDGVKVADALQRLGRYTDSSIIEEDGKLRFYRWTEASSDQVVLDNAQIMDASLLIDDAEILNRQYVYGDYDVNSNYWKIAAFDQNTSSVNSFGLHTELLRDRTIWYVDSQSTLNMAQRLIFTNAEPYEQYKVKTTLAPVYQQIGDTIKITDNQLDEFGGAFRLMGYELNLDTLSMSIDLDNSRFSDAFRLDHATLGLLDQSNNPLL